MTMLSTEVAKLVSSINTSGTEAEQRASSFMSSTEDLDGRWRRLSDRVIELRAEIKKLEKIKEGKDYASYLANLNEEIERLEELAELAEDNSRRTREILKSWMREQVAMKSLFKKYGVLKMPKKIMGMIEVSAERKLDDVHDNERVSAFMPLYEEALGSSSTKNEVDEMMKDVRNVLKESSQKKRIRSSL